MLNLEESPAAEPHQSLAAPADHPEFFPLTNFAGLLHGPARGNPVDSIRLETTGVTQHFQHPELFNRQLLYKSSVAAKLQEAGCHDLAEILHNCHSHQSWAECTGCRKLRTFWNRCDNFFCPACQPRLARERAESIEFWTHLIKQPKHVVLTWRNTEQITFGLIKARKAQLTRLRKSKLFRAVRGGTWSLEFTLESRGWHGHFHLCLDADYIDKSALAVKWGKLVGQDFAIVHISDCRGKDYLREVTKYAVKGSELARWSGLDIAAFINAIQGQRLFGVFGSLYGKRTEWRKWLDSICASKRACECGCEMWRIYSATEWEAHLLELELKAGRAGNPPPKRRAGLTTGDFKFVQAITAVNAFGS